mmetsp:Transcript_12215/g.26002  ORF Transcript_12215/g.26002 Transcript_12215/m.26002 type:complete len:98 (-) Transcript_12215:195-488(-)
MKLVRSTLLGGHRLFRRLGHIAKEKSISESNILKVMMVFLIEIYIIYEYHRYFVCQAGVSVDGNGVFEGDVNCYPGPWSCWLIAFFLSLSLDLSVVT